MLSIPDALEQLFGVRGCEYLRNIANTFATNGTVRVQKFDRSERKRVFIRESELPALHNAVVLHAVFGDTRVVKEILADDLVLRHRHAEAVAALFFQRNSLLGVALQSEAVRTLVEALRGDGDLRRSRLPNPFEILPQKALGEAGGLLRAVLAQAGTLSAGDSVLMAYLQKDLESARRQILALGDLPEGLAPLRQRILEDYEQAVEFDELLDSLRKM